MELSEWKEPARLPASGAASAAPTVCGQPGPLEKRVARTAQNYRPPRDRANQNFVTGVFYFADVRRALLSPCPRGASCLACLAAIPGSRKPCGAMRNALANLLAKIWNPAMNVSPTPTYPHTRLSPVFRDADARLVVTDVL